VSEDHSLVSTVSCVPANMSCHCSSCLAVYPRCVCLQEAADIFGDVGALLDMYQSARGATGPDADADLEIIEGGHDTRSVG
jgi:hypothetical protein